MSDDTPSITHKYDKFLHRNGMPYAYIEVPASFLAEELPEDANWSAIYTYDDQGEVTSSTQKTIEQYCLAITKSLDETKAVIRLSALKDYRYRIEPMTYDDLQDWETWLDTKSYTIDTWLTISERNTLLASSDYEQE
tara:strand:- start:254 stop:664 length:411 start_codon:yes stop_codon:yes gene_type:complete